jgi:hypothetical protein
MDFTITKYKQLLELLQKSGYSFQTFSQFVENPKAKVVVLRHDVDKLPANSLKFALMQEQMGIAGSYYFRIIKKSFNKEIINKIFLLGHEIGYHYETMDTCKGNVDTAYLEFTKNLNIFRELVKIDTICMHGSPISKFDNRAIWEKYNYKELKIMAEPYFDVDFNKVFYLTDTGRRFDGDRVSIRDKPRQLIKTKWPSFHSIDEIFLSIKKGTFPDSILMTFHPQRWTNNIVFWAKEYILQNTKNIIKKRMVIKSDSKKTYL